MNLSGQREPVATKARRLNETPNQKPCSEACERNKSAILEVLRKEFAKPANVLEIGSGTGQHAVFFAAQLPHLVWQTSDVREHHKGILEWVNQSDASNLRAPLALDVVHDPWPEGPFGAAFSANTAHIMSWPEVLATLDGIRNCLEVDGRFCLYGPFSYDGEHTSPSNTAFDAMLRGRDPESGIRDVASLRSEAAKRSLQLIRDHAMPANNRILVFRREELSK